MYPLVVGFAGDFVIFPSLNPCLLQKYLESNGIYIVGSFGQETLVATVKEERTVRFS